MARFLIFIILAGSHLASTSRGENSSALSQPETTAPVGAFFPSASDSEVPAASQNTVLDRSADDGANISAINPSSNSGKSGAWIWFKKLALRIFYTPFNGLFSNMIFAFPFWGALVLTLTLERLFPAEPNRKILSVSFAQDLMWFLYEPVLHALIVGTYVALMAKVYGWYFSHLTFAGLTATPAWIRFVLALLLVDLGYWLQHYINHKVPFLWKLHALHHSQRQLNFFTDFRYHPLEYVVRHTFITVPFLFLKIDPPVIVAVAVIKEWYSRFYHGNIRTNLGLLRYVLVTPQSHRIHHSVEAHHHDVNFGAIFSFWDFLFRKQYKGFDEYPATGIADEHFPHEQKFSLRSLLLTPWLHDSISPLGTAQIH
jgi:sterol desaturase/sphingolipid hydroxylase (fatty acid hydroxylase superfamily)